MGKVVRTLSIGQWAVEVSFHREGRRQVTWRRHVYGLPHIYRDIIDECRCTMEYISTMKLQADRSVESRLIKPGDCEVSVS